MHFEVGGVDGSNGEPLAFVGWLVSQVLVSGHWVLEIREASGQGIGVRILVIEVERGGDLVGIWLVKITQLQSTRII